METWKAIPGFSRYEASTEGRVRSLNYKRSRRVVVLKPALSSDGYLKTMLQGDDGKYHTNRIHKWVANTYLGPCPSGLEINHRDGNKLNNAPSNLEYCTRSENMQHAYDNGLQKPKRGQSNPCSKLTNEQVIEIRQYARQHGRLVRRKQLAEKYGVTEAHLKDIVSGRRGVWMHVDA